eukprot:3902249-Amphidinium_carterae.1
MNSAEVRNCNGISKIISETFLTDCISIRWKCNCTGRTRYTKEVVVDLEDGQSLSVVADTQVIESFWKLIRDKNIGSADAIEDAVRMAQHRYRKASAHGLR